MSKRVKYEAIRMANEVAEKKVATLREAVRISEERAAPVAEAGDGEVRAIETRDVWKEQDVWENLIHTATQHFGHGAVVEFLRREFENVQAVPMARLSALEAERARADELSQERDQALIQIKANIAAIDRAKEFVRVAEQRAADALARAEKAEGALETARGLAERGAHLARTVSQTRFRLEDAGRYSLSMFDANNMVALAYSAARALRETQPATDGGDNG